MQKKLTTLQVILASVPLVTFLTVAVAGQAGAPAQSSSSSSSDRTLLDGVYTTAQAERGGETFERYCSHCHGRDLGGGEYNGDIVPPLYGEKFLAPWGNLNNLLIAMRRMPYDNIGIVDDPGYADVMAFLIQQNGFPEGPNELKPTSAILRTIRVVPAPH